MRTEKEQPLVSVVIPAYNAEKTLCPMLDCVLRQTWENLQVILVDDGSTDGTLELARNTAEQDARLTVVSGGNRGISATRSADMRNISATGAGFITWPAGMTPYPATG